VANKALTWDVTKADFFFFFWVLI